ncbi:MAG TPA: Gfo/Idh/MocA family oxidoreductase [Devosiaceae bacterium]|nr:Gfo/Idh/MocA family oxidoreductase [Devosiaceae bacterium]
MLNIGILGAARIAPAAIIEPARRRGDTTILAVATRSGKAAAYAETHGIARVYDDYAALLADPGIDIVYNALPCSEHGPQTIAALEAGKHVLCEKPCAMRAGDARDMVAAAERAGKLFVEAFHDRYHPVFLHALKAKQDGRFGAIRSLKAVFTAEISNRPGELRYIWEMGGGALMDLGCYPLHWVRSFMQEEPEIVSASGTRAGTGVDEAITAELRFGSGVSAQLSCDMGKGRQFAAEFAIEAENGTMTVKNPVLAHRGHSIIEELDGQKREFTLAGGTTYDYQLEALVGAIGTGAPLPTGGADAIGNMAAIDAIYAAAGFPPR